MTLDPPEQIQSSCSKKEPIRKAVRAEPKDCHVALSNPLRPAPLDTLRNDNCVAGLERQIKRGIALQCFFVMHWDFLLHSSFVTQDIDLL